MAAFQSKWADKKRVGKNVPQNIHKFIFCGKHIENQKQN